MAKRGETRPWRLRFEWDNGVRGTSAFFTEEDARRAADDMRDRSDRGVSPATLVSAEVSHR